MNSSRQHRGQGMDTHSGQAGHLPREDHHKVHDVPAIPQVGALVESKSERDDLDPRLKAEDADEVGLCVILGKHRAPLLPTLQWLGQQALLRATPTVPSRALLPCLASPPPACVCSAHVPLNTPLLMGSVQPLSFCHSSEHPGSALLETVGRATRTVGCSAGEVGLHQPWTPSGCPPLLPLS